MSERFFKQTLMLIMAIVAASGITGAEEKSVLMESLTVTAERFPVKEKESPRFVTVISSEQLTETGANNLVDAMNRAGGFAYKAYAPMGISHGGMNSSLTIRGIKDGELILINGSPIQGAAGHAYDLNTIPLDQIERIEILKGAASTLYGADAMSGVINIITKKTRKETAFKASTEFGTESYHNHSLSVMIPNINLGFNYQHLGAQEEISRSFSQKYRYDLDAADKYSWNLNASLSENLHIDYMGSFYETGFQKHYDSNSKPSEGTEQEHFKNFADLRYETPVFKAKIFGNYDEMRRLVYTTPDDPESKNKNYNSGAESDYKFDLSGWQFNVGADWIYRAADYSTQYGKHHRNDYALFAQVKKMFWESLEATAGAREQFIDGESGTDDYDQFLPSLGLSYRFTDKMNLFANAGKAFRAPTFNNLYYQSSFMVGNPDLGPEQGWTYETGMKYDNDFLRLRFSAFYMSYKDKIEIDKTRGYPQTYFNAGNYDSKGMEWEAGISPFVRSDGYIQDISFYTSGYWADPVAEDTKGEEYQSGPKFQSSLGIEYLTDVARLDLNCQILSSRDRELDTTAVLNFYSKYRLWKGSLIFSADNVFDKEVQVSGDMSADASNRYAYYEVGRIFKVGYEISF